MEKEIQRVCNKNQNIDSVFDQYRNKIREISSEDLKNKQMNIIQKYEEEKNGFKLNVYFCGQICVGKTTAIRKLLANMNSGYKDLLVSEINENSYYFVTIEKSKNKELSSQFDNETVILYNNIEDLQKFLEKLNKEGKKKHLENSKRANRGKKCNQERIPVVKICLPDFDPNFRLIDCPGTSQSEFITKQIEDMILQNKFANVFMYILSLTEQKTVIDVNIKNLINSIMAKNLNTKIYFSIGKIDILADIIKKEDKNQIDSFKKHIEDIFSFILNWEKRYKFKTLGVMPFDNDKNKENVKKILEDLNKFYDSSKEDILIRGIFPNLKYDITQIYNEHQKELGNKRDVYLDSLRKKSKLISKNLQDDLNKKIGEFMEIKSLDNYKDKYPEHYKTFINEFRKRDKELTSTYTKRNTYIKDQVSVLGKIIEAKLDEELIAIYNKCFKEIFNELVEEEYEKISKIMKLYFNVDISETENIGILIFSNILVQSARLLLMEIITDGAAIVFVPVIGWAIGVGLGILSVKSVKNYIGFWTRDGCIEDTFETIIDHYKANNPKKVVNIIENYNKEMERIFASIATRNYSNKELEKLMKLNNSFVIESLENEQELKKMIENGMKNNYSAETEGELKPFFESLRYEAMPEVIDDDDDSDNDQ